MFVLMLPATIVRCTTSTTLAPSTYTADVQFKFKEDFDTIVTMYGSEGDAEKQICNETRINLNLDEDEFANCKITKGSVLVTFQILQTFDRGNKTVDRLNAFVANNVFTLTRPDGSKLNTESSSVYVNGNHELQSGPTAAPPGKQKDDDPETIAIISILIFLIICGLVLVLFLLIVLLRKNKRKVNI